MSNDLEDVLEESYWKFDAKRKGYAEYKHNPQSERDAFKQEIRGILNKSKNKERLLADDVMKVAIKTMVKNYDCCGVPNKFCSTDEWKGNLYAFSVNLIDLYEHKMRSQYEQ